MDDIATIDVRVHGDGPVGRAAALALAQIGLRVVLHGMQSGAVVPPGGGRDPAPQDIRAYALNAGSIALLESLGVWTEVPAAARTPVHAMDVRGDDGGHLAFSAYDQAERELAVIVDAAALDAALAQAVAQAVARSRVRLEPPVPVGAAAAAASASLVVHAEGRAAEAALGTDVVGTRRAYGQRAIAARLVATEPHANVARQWFARGEILALLPLDQPEPGRSLALVWSVPEARADALLALDETAFAAALAEASGRPADAFIPASPRQSWPLHARSAARASGAGWVLVGDAAHVVHPLAGQGLNLGFADVASLAEVIAAREPWRTPGDERLLRRHVRRRAAPIAAMLRTTDALQRLFARDSAWVRQLRNNGMSLLDRVRPLKRWLAGHALDRAAPHRSTRPTP